MDNIEKDIEKFCQEKLKSPEKEIKQLNFFLCRDSIQDYEKRKEERSINQIDKNEIDIRASEIHSDIIEENRDLKEKISDLKEDHRIVIGGYDQDLFNLQKEKFSLEKSHQEYADSLLANQEINYAKHTDLLTERINSLETEKKGFVSIQNKFIEINSNKSSAGLGKDGEIYVYHILQADSEFEVEDVHDVSEQADYKVIYNGKNICTDSKNWTSTVDKKEQVKLLNDVTTNKFDGGAIISLKTRVINPLTKHATRRNIEVIDYMGKPLLLLSNAFKFREVIPSVLKMFVDSAFFQNSNNNIKNDVLIIKSIAKMLDGEIKEEEEWLKKDEKNAALEQTHLNSLKRQIRLRETQIKEKKLFKINIENGNNIDIQSEIDSETEESEIEESDIEESEIEESDIEESEIEESEIGSPEESTDNKKVTCQVLKDKLKDSGKYKDKDVRNKKKDALLQMYADLSS